ncbi:unnamed protein product [Lepidochelys olivacea]
MASAPIILYLYGKPNTRQDMEPAGNLAEFSIGSVSRRDAGTDSCYYQPKGYPFMRSQPSHPVELVVAEPSYPKPNISLLPSEGVAPRGAVTVRCECRCRGARVFLSKSGDPDARHVTDSAGDLVEFLIHNVSRRDAGSYSCQHSTKGGPPVWPEPSDPVELAVAEGTNPAGTQQPDPPMTEPAGEGGTDPTQLGTVPAPTCPGSTGPSGSEPRAAPDLTRPIMAGVSAAAAGLLLFLLAFLCYRSTRGNTLVGEGKQLDVLPQEPDPEAEGLTYAELDHQGLQAKRGGPAPAPEPVLYTAINVSQGAHRQSPQGAGAPPHPHSMNPGGVIAATGQGALAIRG